MDCEQALILISAALDGELTENERAAMEEHLKECPECRALSEDFGVVSVALSAMNAEPPADLISRVNAVLDAEQVPAAAPKKAANWKKWGSLVAMFAVVVCLGGVYLFSGLGGGSTANDAAAPQASSYTTTAENRSGAAMDDLETAEEAAPAEAYGAADTDSGDAQFNGSAEISNAIVMDTVEKTVPAMDAALTSAEAAEQVFDYLGGETAYPGAVWQEDATECVLEQTETETERVKLMLRYTGLSGNGCYYTFQTYRETLDDFIAVFAYVNNYAVKLDGSELLVEQDGMGEDTSGAYRTAIGE